MKKVLVATVALGVCAVLGAGSSRADVITGVKVWTGQNTAATTLVPSGSNDTITPAVGSDITFNLQTSLAGGGNGTVGAFIATAPGPAWTASNGAAILQNGANPGLGTIFQFTGTITVTAGEVLSVTSDDGETLSLNGVIPASMNHPGARSAGPPDTFTVVTPGTDTFVLTYGECCSLPAVLEFTAGGVEVGNHPVPEPATMAILGTALLGFGLLRRRRNRS